MKIRNGFVSNSSSSSFILRFKNCSYEEFETVVLQFDYMWNLKELKQRIEDNLTKRRTYLKEYDTYEYKMLYSREDLENQIVFWSELLDLFHEDTTKFLLKFYGYKIVNENPLVLESFTIMHNSYQESLSKFMVEMIFLLNVEFEKNIIITRED